MSRTCWKVMAAAGAMLSLAGGAAAQTDAQFFVIDAAPGSEVPGTQTNVYSVNGDGSVVVGRMFGELTSGSGLLEGAFFRWTPSGGVEILRLPDGSTSEQDIRGGSHDGSRIFGVEYNPDPRATLSGWYWTEDPAGSGMGPVVSIPADPYFGSEIHCSSADGSVMFGYYNSGTFQVPSPNWKEALRWSETSGYQTLPFLDPSHNDAWVFDCSDDGNIAVGHSNDKAVMWNVSGGTVTDMNVGIEGGFATAVSANGLHAAGARTEIDPVFQTHLSKGFKWSAATGVEPLDPFGFSNLVVPTAIANDGQTVVGADGSIFYDAPWGNAFIWTGSSGYQPFADYVLFDVNVTNADLNGWSFPVITDMSGDGNIFAGTAATPEGELVGFVLYVGVEPPFGDPCVCETDGTAGVNVFDLLGYLDLWFAQDAAADIDSAAGVDVFDLLFFLDCWFPASAGAEC